MSKSKFENAYKNGIANEYLTVEMLNEDLKAMQRLAQTNIRSLKAERIADKKFDSEIVGTKILTKADIGIYNTRNGELLCKISLKKDLTGYAHNSNVENFIKSFKDKYGKNSVPNSVEMALHLLYGTSTRYTGLVNFFATTPDEIRKNRLTTENIARLDASILEDLLNWCDVNAKRIAYIVMILGNFETDIYSPDVILCLDAKNSNIGHFVRVNDFKKMINGIRRGYTSANRTGKQINFIWGDLSEHNGIFSHFNFKRLEKFSTSKIKMQKLDFAIVA